MTHRHADRRRFFHWIILPALACLAGGTAIASSHDHSGHGATAAPASAAPSTGATIRIPDRLSPAAQNGQAAFQENCAQCHGPLAQGTENGPPLMHRFYEPGHHADAAILRAIRQGTRQHHWNFGDMPAQTQVAPDQANAIVRFLREMQKANGIY